MSSVVDPTGRSDRSVQRAKGALRAARRIAGQRHVLRLLWMLPDLDPQPCVQAEPGAADLGGTEAAGGIAGLSDAERRVAELAVVGHTNREIACRLFITVSTVEQHLTRVFRKLGVSGRKKLPPVLNHSMDDSVPVR